MGNIDFTEFLRLYKNKIYPSILGEIPNKSAIGH